MTTSRETGLSDLARQMPQGMSTKDMMLAMHGNVAQSKELAVPLAVADARAAQMKYALQQQQAQIVSHVENAVSKIQENLITLRNDKRSSTSADGMQPDFDQLKNGSRSAKEKSDELNKFLKGVTKEISDITADIVTKIKSGTLTPDDIKKQSSRIKAVEASVNTKVKDLENVFQLDGKNAAQVKNLDRRIKVDASLHNIPVQGGTAIDKLNR